MKAHNLYALVFVISLIIGIQFLDIDWTPVGPMRLGGINMPAARRATVTKVIDAETIQIKGGQQIRLIGIDAPQFESETIDYYGQRIPAVQINEANMKEKEAVDYVEGLLLGKEM